MDDIELIQRLKRMADDDFESLLARCLDVDQRAWLPPSGTARAARAIALAQLSGNTPRVRAAVVECLGGERPVAQWIAWGVRRYSRIPVLGFHGRVELSLDDVFVQLQVQAGAHDPVRETRALGPMHETRTVTPSEALSLSVQTGHAGIVLLGDPGSGKTTLLQHLYTRMALGDPDLGVTPDAVPVLVRCASIDARARTTGGLREIALAEARRNGFPAAGELLRAEPPAWLFLLDGLDEVRDEATRVAMCRWLDDEVSYFPNARFVVTCRYAAWKREARLNNRFLPVDVLLLNDERVRDYVQRWFVAVGLGLRGASAHPTEDEVRQRAKSSANGVLEVLLNPARQAQWKLRELTSNPLLLSTLCLVSHDDKKLPKERAELYDRCISLLLEMWTETKDGKRALPNRPTQLVMQPLAWEMHQRPDRVELSRAELEAMLAEKLRGVQGVDLSAEEVIERATEDCGLLVSRDVDRYRFFHLTFQEYLAACYARRLRLERELADRAGDPRWKEVILLAVSRDGLFAPFVRTLAAREGFAQHHALLWECLQDVDAWDEAPFVEVLERLRTAEAARAAWAARPTWRRALARWEVEPLVAADLVTAATMVLTLLRGHTLAGVRACAEAFAAHRDDGLRAAACAFLGVKEAYGRERIAEGQSFVERLTGMEMLWIPSGRFPMGSSKTPGQLYYDQAAFDDEFPIHLVTLTQGFRMGRFPVTNAAWAVYMQATGIDPPEFWANRRFNDPAQPVVAVDHNEARSFCRWLTQNSPSAKQGLHFDLPTEAEWEYAARGTDGRRYPWGQDAPTPEIAVYAPQDSTARVGEHPRGKSPFGCEDMAGNVWEWCLDHGRDSYESEIPVVDPCHLDASAASTWVVRGGSWFDPAGDLRCAARHRRNPRVRLVYLGFRVVCRGSRQLALSS